MAVNCQGCRWWDDHGRGIGACELTKSMNGQAVHKQSKFVAFALTPDGKIDDKATAVCFTDERGCCNQFEGR